MTSSSKKIRVIVGMSGGVDSSVAALLLKKQGYDVHGLFMKNWEGDDDEAHCSATIDVNDAKAVCDRLDIPLHTVNFAKDYWDNVFHHFLEEYRQGRTPNPDILCNKEIKFKTFLEHAMKLGAEYIATGHYVRREKNAETFSLLRGVDANKDQSYFLYTLNQQQLASTLFPLGELTKPKTRLLAKEAGFINHARKGSTGICFIGERKFKNFLSQYLPAQPGNIETPEGKVIGTHEGLMFYTLGQRQGLGIGGQRDATDSPWYVLEKNLSRNVLIVGQGEHPLLFSHQLYCNEVHWIRGESPVLPFKCTAKTRYRMSDQPCTVKKMDENNYCVTFDVPQRAITPGQSVVFYQEDLCLGGGIINF